ncbi:MAG: hypothetical protein ACI93T_000527 [Porticoccaceae bacterium]|jgi:hypothetical protein
MTELLTRSRGLSPTIELSARSSSTRSEPFSFLPRQALSGDSRIDGICSLGDASGLRVGLEGSATEMRDCPMVVQR